jgi:hypothetical protein
MPCSAQVVGQQPPPWSGAQTPGGSLQPPHVMPEGQVPQSRVPQQPSGAGPQV